VRHHSDSNCAALSQADDNDPAWLDALGILPSPIFITAFTITVHTFAKITRFMTYTEWKEMRIFTFSLMCINAVVYIACIFDLARDSNLITTIFLWSLVVGNIFIAGLLFGYGRSLYRHFTSPSLHASARIKKLYISSLICFLCISTKSVIIMYLFFTSGSEYTTWSFPMYYVVSEVIPEAMMLVIFSTSDHPSEKSRKPGTKQEAQLYDNDFNTGGKRAIESTNGGNVPRRPTKRVNHEDEESGNDSEDLLHEHPGQRLLSDSSLLHSVASDEPEQGDNTKVGERETSQQRYNAPPGYADDVDKFFQASAGVY